MNENCEENSGRIPVLDALRVLADCRRNGQVVIANQGSARLWPKLSEHALDFNYNPSAMGAAVPFALGIALGSPQREVLVISGEGSLLMNLGCLVTVIDSGVTNLSIVVLDNGLYEVTGGQKTAAAATRTDFAGLARAAGFPNVAHFWNQREWEQRAGGLLDQPGPRFVWLEVGRANPADLQARQVPLADQLEKLRSALQR